MIKYHAWIVELDDKTNYCQSEVCVHVCMETGEKKVGSRKAGKRPGTTEEARKNE